MEQMYSTFVVEIHHNVIRVAYDVVVGCDKYRQRMRLPARKQPVIAQMYH